MLPCCLLTMMGDRVHQKGHQHQHQQRPLRLRLWRRRQKRKKKKRWFDGPLPLLLPLPPLPTALGGEDSTTVAGGGTFLRDAP